MRLIAGLAVLSLLGGCTAQGEEKPTREELEAEVLSLRDQLADTRERLDAVDTATSDLQTATGSFQDTNWREVVPEVDQRVQDLDAAVTEALEAVGCDRAQRCG
jgi:hypothetical protein